MNLDTGLQLITALATSIGASAVIAAILQLRDTRRWNTMSSTFHFSLNRPDIRELEMKLDETPVRLLQRSAALSGTEMEQLKKDERSAGLLAKYLNILEEYCLAVNTGVINAVIAKVSMSTN